jgi:hypothetical protein
MPMDPLIYPAIRRGLLFLSLSWAFHSMAQDSLPLSQVDQRIQRTTRMAFLLPGSGQILNHKYWKAPLVWGGIGYCISAIHFNQEKLNLYRNSIIAASNGEVLPDPSLLATQPQWRQLETEYQKQRDLSYLALLGVHLLSVLDAHVDANLMEFDVGEDLSLHLAPIHIESSARPSSFGLRLNWSIGATAPHAHSNHPATGRSAAQPL